MNDIDLNALRERFCCLTRAIRDTGVERKAFEAWAIERKFDVTSDNQCGYESEKTLGAWRAWGVTPSEDIRLALSLLDRLEAAERERDELRKDAERWRAIPAFVEDYQINYLAFERDIDEFVAQEGGK